MMNRKNTIRHMALITATVVMASCGNLTAEVESKLNELKSKSESLDSLLNTEVSKVYTLDSLINTEHEKVKQLDSVIKSKTQLLEQLTR